MTAYILPSGEAVPDEATDQPGSTLLIRTVRGEVAAAASLYDDEAAAQRIARDLDRRGYLPPERPITWAEIEAMGVRSGQMRRLLWALLGLGLPMHLAMDRCRIPQNKQASWRRMAQRSIKAIGWGIRED